MSTRNIILIAIVAVFIAVLAFVFSSPILFVGEDSSEGAIPGVDMAATWSLTGGFEWIYPGSSFNSKGETLHNIYMINPDNPYQAAKEIMEYTYHFSPHIIVSINTNAANQIFGDGIVDNIRSYDWGQGYDRGPASQQAMSEGGINIFAVPICLLSGDLKIILV